MGKRTFTSPTAGIIGAVCILSLSFPSVFAQTSETLPDFDESGAVDFADFLVFARGFGTRAGDDDGYDARLDLNGDGAVNFPDFISFVGNYGKSVVRQTSRRLGLPPQGKLYHGVFPGHLAAVGEAEGEEDDITLADLQSYEKAVGKTAAWVYFSHNWYVDRKFPVATATWIRDAGSVPFIRLMLRSDSEQNKAEPTYTLDRIIGGAFDDDLKTWAEDARNFGSPLIVEYGTEVNGEWFAWNGVWNGGERGDGYGDPTAPDGPERFRDAYRHIVGIVRAQGADNITWVFHVDQQDAPEEPWNRLEAYYPGDAWVDWIGVSVYGAATPMEDEWPAFRDMMDAVYPRLVSLSSDKPLALLEFGVTAGHASGDQAAWADRALSDLTSQRWPRLIGFSWWNEFWENDDDPRHNTNMRVQDNPALADAIRLQIAQNDGVLGQPIFVGDASPTATRDYRSEMRQFVQNISADAKQNRPGFLVIPQNGHTLLTEDGDAEGPIAQAYVNTIDGVGREDLFYGYDEDDTPTPIADRDDMVAFMDLALKNGVEVLVTDYCATPSHVDDSHAQNAARGYRSFAADHRELDDIPAYPQTPFHLNSREIATLRDAQNFLYLLNTGAFPSKEAFVGAVKQTDFDLLITDLFFRETDLLNASDVAALKVKKSGGTRLVVAYMSIGEAEDYRYYWKPDWKTSPPGWLAAENPFWPGNYVVRYWDADWQRVIYGASDSYLQKILDAGFDGVYLDIIDAYEYFEEHPQDQ